MERRKRSFIDILQPVTKRKSLKHFRCLRLYIIVEKKGLCTSNPPSGGLGVSLLHYQSEAIAMDIDDLDLRIVFQILSEFCNVNVHASSVEISIAAPDLF